jgi:hypothetical protein
MGLKNDKSENNHVAKIARNAIAKSQLDISGLHISCHQGTQIQLTGQVKQPVGFTGDMNVRQEFEALKHMLLTVHGVREVNGDFVKLL